MGSCVIYNNYFAGHAHTTTTRPNEEEKIQKVINGMAIKMRNQHQPGCYYIEAINEFIATGTI